MTDEANPPLNVFKVIPAEPGTRAICRDECPDDPHKIFYVSERIIAWAFVEFPTAREEEAINISTYPLSVDGECNCDGIQYADGQVHVFFEGDWDSLEDLNKFSFEQQKRKEEK